MGNLVQLMVAGLLLMFAVTSHGVPSGNSDLCHSATCGLGATCSQVSNLIVCTCLDGYEGEAFKECIPVATTVSSQPSSSLSATSSHTTTTTVASTTPSSTTTAATTTTVAAITTTEPLPATSETVFNIPVRTQSYYDTPRAPTPVQPVYEQPQQERQDTRRHQQIPAVVVTEDSLLQQYPSAPPTLSHYAPTFQQKLHAQQIQFGIGSQSSHMHSHSQSHPMPVVQNVNRDTANHGSQYQPALFDGTRTRERPPQQSQSHLGDLGPINGQSNDEKYYLHNNAHQSSQNNRVNYQGGGVGSGSSSSSVTQVESNSGSYNQVPFHTHTHNSNGQNNYQGSQSVHASGPGSSKGDVDPIRAGPVPVQDYQRRPIAGNGNSNRYPINSNNGNVNVGVPEHDDEDEMRDATFIKDPLGKYEKCHSVNNIIVCADNTNAGSAKQEIKNSHSHYVPSPTDKPLETRRVDTRPINSNSNNNNNHGIGESRIPIFPASGSGSSHSHRIQSHNYHQTQQQQTTYYPSSSRHPAPSSANNQHYFESQFPNRYPNPVSDFTSPSSVGSHIPSTTINDPSTNSICKRYCGEGAVCRVVLERPVCGCSEGHTGDPTIRCTPIINSKYDTKSCQRHTDCSQSEVCHQSRCADPCDETARTSRSNRCGFNATCRVIEHTQLCSCNTGFNGNPYLGCT